MKVYMVMVGRTRFLNSLLLFFFLCIFSYKALAQTLSVGLLDNVEDNFRRKQLLGTDSTGSSFMLRPFALPESSDLRKVLYQNPSSSIVIYALPVVLQQQYNSHHPYGMNDNAMVQAKGYQAMVSGGLYAKIGPLRIQLRPEYVYAANPSFEGPEDNPDLAFQNAYARLVYNKIDNPSQFGTGAYKKGSWGQSSIRLTFDPISFGLSSENLWWGPGVRNSLLMSNNATGFKHLTLNTTRPIDIYIGKIEAQLISGRLESSGIGVPPDLPASYAAKYLAKPDDWRYISGGIITYQPKWIPGLYLGLNRTFVVYHSDMGHSLADYIPIFNGINKIKYYDESTANNAEDAAKRDQYFSAFARWVMPESRAEVYFEYGRNDHSVDFRDYAVEPEHSRAYIAGFRKLVELNPTDQFLQIGIEFTQLESPKTGENRAAPTWYEHHQVFAGYTNKGQVLGAGIGPGSNMQSLEISWVENFKKIGFSLERVVNNNDFLYNAGLPVRDVRRHWVDYAFGGNFSWDFNKIILNSQLTYIRSLNYQWRLEDDGGFFWDWPKTDVNNLHFKVGVLYNF